MPVGLRQPKDVKDLLKFDPNTMVQVVELQTLHGMMSVNQTDVLPKKVSELTYYGTMHGDDKVTIELEGNCCWKFYGRSHYRGTLKSVRGSGTVIPDFAPRSMEAVEC